MPELTLRNIEVIASDVGSLEIRFSHLSDELIDHVCCDVENEMKKGLSFHEAYSEVKKKIGPRRLREIQEETLYLVDTKYRNMKNTMKFSGVAGTVLLGFAALFKIQHWPAAGIMLTLGAMMLAMVFLPSALSVVWKESHSKKRIFLYVSAFLAAFFFIMGALFKIQHWPMSGLMFAIAFFSGTMLFIPAMLVKLLGENKEGSDRLLIILGAAGFFFYFMSMLFKIQHWPGSSLLLITGLIILCLIVLPWYTWKSFKNEAKIKGTFLFIIIGSLSVVIPGGLINLNLQNSYDAGYYNNLDQQQATFESWQKNNKSFINSFKDSLCYADMADLDKQAEAVVAVFNRVAREMIMEAEGRPGMPVADPYQVSSNESGQLIRYRQLSKPFDTAPAQKHLTRGAQKAGELEQALKEYNLYLSGISAKKKLPDFSSQLDPAVCLGPGYSSGKDISFLAALHALNLTRNQILAIEARTLKELASN